MDLHQFETRKRDHIHHALDSQHQAQGLSGLDQIVLEHDALPEVDLAEISLEARCLKNSLRTPFYIAGMTAGHSGALEINELFAEACSRRGWAMGVGSQRRDFELAALTEASIDRWGDFRKSHPDLALFANLGLSQIVRTSSLEPIFQLVETLGAQALMIHLNALQEALQPEGTPFFKGGLKAIERLCAQAPFPIVLKETGCGFSESTLKKMNHLHLAAVDVSGLGGTHWGRIEGARAPEGSLFFEGAKSFANWGVPTAESVLLSKGHLSADVEIWASGGVRNGVDAAKLIAIGAHRVGYAQPALQAALKGKESLDRWMQQQEFELRVALFCTGSLDPQTLREKKSAWKPLMK